MSTEKVYPVPSDLVGKCLIDEQTYKLGILRQVRDDLFGGDLNRLLDLLKDDADLPSEDRDLVSKAAS